MYLRFYDKILRTLQLAPGTVENIMLIYENAKFDMCSNDDYDSDYKDDI